MSSDVLIPIDPQEPEFANKALKMAQAQALANKGKLHILTVVPEFNMPLVASYFPDDAMEQAMKAVQKKMEAYLKKAISKALKVRLYVKTGDPCKQIIKLAKKQDVAMIVIPSLKHSRVGNVLIGSVTSKVVERANCSVLVVRE